MKIFIAIITLVFITGSLSAQTENTGERLITQFKNGTVPGMKFAKNLPAAKINTAPGTKYIPATAGAAALRSLSNANRSQSGMLASEQAIKKETIKSIAAPPPISNQEEMKQDNKQ